MSKLDRAKVRIRKLMMKYDFIQGMTVQQSPEGKPQVILRINHDTPAHKRDLLPKEIEHFDVLIGEVTGTRYGPGSPHEEGWASRFLHSQAGHRGKAK